MKSAEIRDKFLKFFEEKGHKIVPSSSLVPEGDSSTLFVSAGVQPLAPYILGQAHPAGKRIVNIQKCVRVQDIDEVGDKTHDTFFEMMGNWSFNDYFKEDAIKWSYELLTDKEKGFGLDVNRLYVTVFEGNDNAPRDEESFQIWKSLGIPEERIYFMDEKSNWWSAGDNGPCGPDTEMFYDVTKEGLDLKSKEEYMIADEKQQVVEVWNDVFMEYLKKDGKVVGKLETRNVDTGSGLERITMAVQGKDNIFDTDLFSPIMDVLDKYHALDNLKAKRIIADHIRTSVFMVGDGVKPSNKDRGYILRRLIRRAGFQMYRLGIMLPQVTEELVRSVSDNYKTVYPKLGESEISDVIEAEMHRFFATLETGEELFNKMKLQDYVPGKDMVVQSLSDILTLTAQDAFILFTSHGYPVELSKEIALERKMRLEPDFDNKYKSLMLGHQEVSKAGSDQKFKGGLAGHSEMEVKYHTATHLLHQALHDVLGNEVMQKGSNITPERLRFDFSFPRKLTDEEKAKIEEIINQMISEGLSVNKISMPKAEAEKTGARHFFGEKYPDEVSVYYIGDSLESAYSKEFCGGPHVENIGTLGKFKITKEEAVAAGVRRIKATLE